MLGKPSYLDDLLIITNRRFKDHLFELEIVLSTLSTAGMRVNISKSKFFAQMGYWITRQGIQPICEKFEMNAILNIKALKTRKVESDTPVYWYSQLLS
jgi:hypothetical protein